MKTKGKPQAVKPSPLPWVQSGKLVNTADGYNLAVTGDMGNGHADAALIVRAINSYSALIESARLTAGAIHHCECNSVRSDKENRYCNCHVGAAVAALRAAGEDV